MSRLPDTPPARAPEPTSHLRRYALAFGHFWWEFLVGDTPELLVGAVAAVAVVALLAHNGVARAVTVAALPVLVILLLGTSLRRAQRSARTHGRAARTPPPSP